MTDHDIPPTMVAIDIDGAVNRLEIAFNDILNHLRLKILWIEDQLEDVSGEPGLQSRVAALEQKMEELLKKSTNS